MLKRVATCLCVLAFAMLILSSCSDSNFSEKDIFSSDFTNKKKADSLIQKFDKKYNNKTEEGNIITWDVKDTKLFGYEIEKAIVEKNGDELKKVCYRTAPVTWTDSDQVVSNIDSFLAKAKELDKNELKSNGTAYIDGKEWEDPFSNSGYSGTANDARKQLMVLGALDNETNLSYRWRTRYISLTINKSEFWIEIGNEP